MTGLSQQLRAQLRALRLARRLGEARALLRAQPDFAAHAALHAYLREHEDFWWAPLHGRRLTLVRRSAADAEFVRACWNDTDFMRRFNRSARPLPEGDEALRDVLERECSALVSELKALHWTVRTTGGPVGFVSATDINAAHRRCEFLVGVLGPQHGSIAIEAVQTSIAFLRERLGMERLTAHFYPENASALAVATKFGFREEGVLRSFLRNPDGTRSDLVIAGLMLGETYRGAAAGQARRVRGSSETAVDAPDDARPKAHLLAAG